MEEPAGQPRVRAEDGRFPRQEEEDDLGHIFGQRGVPDFAEADRVDEVPVARDQSGERRLGPLPRILSYKPPVFGHLFAPLVLLLYL